MQRYCNLHDQTLTPQESLDLVIKVLGYGYVLIELQPLGVMT